MGSHECSRVDYVVKVRFDVGTLTLEIRTRDPRNICVELRNFTR